MRRRPNLIVVLGVVVFALGVVATFLVVRHNGPSTASATPPAAARTGVSPTRIPVLYARSALAAGARGETSAVQGALEVRSVAASQRPPTALSNPTQLFGKTIAPGGIAAGQPVLAEAVLTPQTAVGTVSIPKGKTALALQLANVPGVAGFAGRGDKIDIYGSGKLKAAAGQPDQNATLLLLQDVDVLSVDGTALAPAPGQPGGQGLVFLVAVTPAQAEKLVYFSTFQQLYFSLLPKDAAAAVATPGVGDATAFRPGP